jgi:hypothetical protein
MLTPFALMVFDSEFQEFQDIHVPKLQARLEAGIESLLLFRRAFASPTMCRFIPALSVPKLPTPQTPVPQLRRNVRYCFS